MNELAADSSCCMVNTPSLNLNKNGSVDRGVLAQ